MAVVPEVKMLAQLVRERVCRWVRKDPEISHDLGGACAIASYALWRVLKAKGHPAVLVHQTDTDEAHCWVEVYGHTVDITATQYDGPPIAISLVGQPPEWAYAYRFKHRRINQNAVREVKKWDNQSPLKYHSKIERLVQSIHGITREQADYSDY
jgi:hypothetical protein